MPGRNGAVGGLSLRPVRGMYNLYVVRSTVSPSYLLFALLVAAFITFYPQLDAAGYCGDGGCPEVSYPAHASGGAVAPGVSFVVAVLVAVSGILPARAARFVLLTPPPDALVGIILSPETPPPRPSA